MKNQEKMALPLGTVQEAKKDSVYCDPNKGRAGMPEIYQFLLSLGVTPNYLGFHYTAYALSLCMNEPQRLLYVTKEVYPDVAERFGTTPQSVERNIRTAIYLAWEKNGAFLEKISHHVWTKRPATSEFLGMIFAYFVYGTVEEKE